MLPGRPVGTATVCNKKKIIIISALQNKLLLKTLLLQVLIFEAPTIFGNSKC
jgi:hypothetical protein